MSVRWQPLSPDIRRAIQTSEESLDAVAARHGVNRKTVAKWRAREGVADVPHGPKERALSLRDRVMALSFRRHTLLPLDDCVYALLPVIPHLTRSSLHRCFQQYGVSRLQAPTRRGLRARDDDLGAFRLMTVVTACHDGELLLCFAIDCASKLYFTAAYDAADARFAEQFLDDLTRFIPYRLRAIVRDGAHGLSIGPNNRLKEAEAVRVACAGRNIRYHVNSSDTPWTRAQILEMNRVTAQAQMDFRDASRRDVARMVGDFHRTYNQGRRLKAIGGLTPHGYIHGAWKAAPQDFRYDPVHHIWD